jgi:CheY-like chemotaxis protein
MSEEIRSRVFDPFFTTKEKGKGTGLGLSVVLGIVQSHRGFADVESSPGAGTTFTLYIPLPSYQKKNPDIRVSEDGTVKGGSETILIVEDEILLLEITQSMLESNGYNVLTAGDGEQAVELYTRHQEEIALVITDMGMPKLSGVEEIKKLREINPHVKIILATGFLESGTKAELLKSGAKEIIQKPYLAKETNNGIHRTFRSSGIHEGIRRTGGILWIDRNPGTGTVRCSNDIEIIPSYNVQQSRTH